MVERHGDEVGYRINNGYFLHRVVHVVSAVFATNGGHADIHPLNRLVRRVVERVRVAHRAQCAGWSLQHRRVPVYGKLRFAIQDEIHLVVEVVQMVARSAMRVEDAAMEEVQIRLERVFAEESCVVEGAGPSMNGLRYLEFARVRVGESL